MNTNSLSTTSTTGRNQHERVSEAVVDAVADADGVSPLDVHPPLATAIDPDALDKVIDGMASFPDEPTGKVSFAYSGYDVTVTEDGGVTVTDAGALD